jgi:hypothetical protein
MSRNLLQYLRYTHISMLPFSRSYAEHRLLFFAVENPEHPDAVPSQSDAAANSSIPERTEQRQERREQLAAAEAEDRGREDAEGVLKRVDDSDSPHDQRTHATEELEKTRRITAALTDVFAKHACLQAVSNYGKADGGDVNTAKSAIADALGLSFRHFITLSLSGNPTQQGGMRVEAYDVKEGGSKRTFAVFNVVQDKAGKTEITNLNLNESGEIDAGYRRIESVIAKHKALTSAQAWKNATDDAVTAAKDALAEAFGPLPHGCLVSVNGDIDSKEGIYVTVTQEYQRTKLFSFRAYRVRNSISVFWGQ